MDNTYPPISEGDKIDAPLEAQFLEVTVSPHHQAVIKNLGNGIYSISGQIMAIGKNVIILDAGLNLFCCGPILNNIDQLFDNDGLRKWITGRARLVVEPQMYFMYASSVADNRQLDYSWNVEKVYKDTYEYETQIVQSEGREITVHTAKPLPSKWIDIETTGDREDQYVGDHYLLACQLLTPT